MRNSKYKIKYQITIQSRENCEHSHRSPPAAPSVIYSRRHCAAPAPHCELHSRPTLRPRARVRSPLAEYAMRESIGFYRQNHLWQNEATTVVRLAIKEFKSERKMVLTWYQLKSNDLKQKQDQPTTEQITIPTENSPLQCSVDSATALCEAETNWSLRQDTHN